MDRRRKAIEQRQRALRDALAVAMANLTSGRGRLSCEQYRAAKGLPPWDLRCAPIDRDRRM